MRSTIRSSISTLGRKYKMQTNGSTKKVMNVKTTPTKYWLESAAYRLVIEAVSF